MNSTLASHSNLFGRNLYPFWAYDEGTWCPHVVWTALAANHIRALEDFDYADGREFAWRPLAKECKGGEHSQNKGLFSTPCPMRTSGIGRIG